MMAFLMLLVADGLFEREIPNRRFELLPARVSSARYLVNRTSDGLRDVGRGGEGCIR